MTGIRHATIHALPELPQIQKPTSPREPQGTREQNYFAQAVLTVARKCLSLIGECFSRLAQGLIRLFLPCFARASEQSAEPSVPVTLAEASLSHPPINGESVNEATVVCAPTAIDETVVTPVRTIIPVEDDGNCLYESALVALQNAGLEVPENSMCLRQSCIEWLLSHLSTRQDVQDAVMSSMDDYRAHQLPRTQSEIQSMAILLESPEESDPVEQVHIFETFEGLSRQREFLEAMTPSNYLSDHLSQNRFFGGEESLLAICELYHVCICVEVTNNTGRSLGQRIFGSQYSPSIELQLNIDRKHYDAAIYI